MIQNVFYSILFGTINLLIYLKLQKAIQPKKAYWFYGFIMVAIVAHMGFIRSYFLMNTEDFFNLSFFSVALIVFHFVTNIQVKLFKKYNNPQDIRAQKLQSFVLLIFDFIRQKLIYIMTYSYQFLAVWNESFR
jgi:hypothetical protein